MFGLLTELFHGSAHEHHGYGIEDWFDRLTHAEDDGADADEALRIVVTILSQLGPDRLATATKVLADGSREERWRLPFGDEGILGFYLDSVTGVKERRKEPEWMSDSLRLIGNCCADYGLCYVRNLSVYVD